jgi:hypothetical protein
MARKKVKPTIAKVQKRTRSEWESEDGLLILRGLAVQCLTFADLAAVLGITERTLRNWRDECPETIGNAVAVARDEADAVCVGVTFDDVLRGTETAVERWWKYRLAPKLARTDTEKPDNVININFRGADDGHSDEQADN